MRTLRRLRGSLTIARHLPGQRRMPYRDPEQVARIRDARVRGLVRYAAETVPHYRELFRRERIDPREIRTADDLDRLPLLAKRDVQQDPRRFVSESRAGREAVLFRTSGSTGMPLDVWHDRTSLLANIGHSERQRAVEAHFCDRRVRYRIAVLDHGRSTASRVQEFYAEASLRPVRPDSNLVVLNRPVEAIVGALNRLRPEVVKGNGTYLETLFRSIDAHGLELHPPRVLAYGSDAMTVEGKAFVEERFGIPVIAHYSAVEAFKIACTCEQRGAYHLHEDLCHVRAVDGELVLTNLVNRGTVLLNYRIGDGGVVGPGGCPCGRTTPLLTSLEGRINAVLELQDGTLVNAAIVLGALKHVPGVLRYQLVQHERAVFELRLATVDRAAFDRVAAEALPPLRGALGGAAVEATCCDELPEDRSFPLFVPLRASL